MAPVEDGGKLGGDGQFGREGASRMPDPEGARLPVDVFPVQCQYFLPEQAGEHGEPKRIPDDRVVQGFDVGAGFAVERAHEQHHAVGGGPAVIVGDPLETVLYVFGVDRVTVRSCV